MDLKDKIHKLRTEQNMTLEQVADKVGVGKSTVRKWESGYIENMRRDKIAKLAEALNTTPAYLMGWEEPQLPVETDEERELNEYLEYLRTRPECRMLMKTVKGATKEEVEANVRVIEAMRGYKHDD